MEKFEDMCVAKLLYQFLYAIGGQAKRLVSWSLLSMELKGIAILVEDWNYWNRLSALSHVHFFMYGQLLE